MLIYYFLTNIKFLFKQNKLKKIFIFFFIFFFKIARYLCKTGINIKIKSSKISNHIVNVLRAPYKNKLAKIQLKTNYSVLILTTNADIDFFFFFLHLVYLKKKEKIEARLF